MRIKVFKVFIIYSTLRTLKSLDKRDSDTTIQEADSSPSVLKSTRDLRAVNSSVENYDESSTSSILTSSNLKQVTTFSNTVTYDEAVLQRNLFKDYNINVRPVSSFHSQVIVTLGLSLRKIQHIDEINQAFKAIVNLFLYWTDQMLVWDKTIYAGISCIEFPFDKNIWTPDIMIYNAMKKPGKLGITDASVRLYNNGQIFVWTQINIETACEIRTKKYPFDVQICEIHFGKFISSDDKILIMPLSKNIDMTEYVKVAEWEIVENKVTTKVVPFNISTDIHAGESAIETLNYTLIIYTLKMRRLCRLCFQNAIIPVMILAVLNLLTFFVPCESGEKTSYPISIFLTLAVFLTIITQSLPESVDGISYLSSYVTFQLIISAITLCCAVISLHIHYKKGNVKMSNNILQFIHKFRNRRSSFPKEETHEVESLESQRQEKADDDKIEYKEQKLDISYVFDKIMFTCLCVCELIVTIIFIYYILN